MFISSAVARSYQLKSTGDLALTSRNNIEEVVNESREKSVMVKKKVSEASPSILERRNVRHVLKLTRRDNVNRFRSCLRERGDDAFTIYAVTDDDAGPYESARLTWNKAQKAVQYPDIVTFPETTRQVSSIVTCAQETEYYVCARNGKHSYESDTCVYGIVVDLDRFNSFDMLDSKRGKARFGAGQHLGHVAVVLSDYKLVMPMGSCPSVGLTGLTLVGGHGMLARHHGLLIDFLSAIEMVDAYGNILNANATNENSDYFWMSRGGGSGVLHFPGIITALEFDNLPTMEKTPETYTTVTFSYEPTVTNAGKLLREWQDFYANPEYQDDPIFRRLMVEPWLKLDRVGPKGLQYKKILELAVYFYGDDDMHRQFMERYLPIIKGFLQTSEERQVRRHDLLAFARLLGGTKNNEELGDGRHGWDLDEQGNYRMNHWKGMSVVAKQKISEEAFRVAASTIFHSKPFSRRYAEFKALGGAMGEVGQDETAFWHRKALWWCLSNHFWLSTDEPDRVEAIRQNAIDRNIDFVKAMKQDNFGGYYAGYIDRTNNTATDLLHYYGEHAERIASIKKKRDPKNLFQLYRPNKIQDMFEYNVDGS